MRACKCIADFCSDAEQQTSQRCLCKLSAFSFNTKIEIRNTFASFLVFHRVVEGEQRPRPAPEVDEGRCEDGGLGGKASHSRDRHFGIRGFQRHFPRDSQWHVPMDAYMFSFSFKGIDICSIDFHRNPQWHPLAGSTLLRVPTRRYTSCNRPTIVTATATISIQANTRLLH